MSMAGKQRMERTHECTEFQERLPELVRIGRRPGWKPHLATCEKCSALVGDLQYIAQQAKLLLPIHDPSPQVWDNIQSALKKEPSRIK